MIMDSFIDLFAQRKNAQEMIKANSQAEAKENQQLHQQLKNYEEAIESLRKQSLQNAENAEKVNRLVNAGIEKVEALQKDENQEAGKVLELCEALKEELSAARDEMKQMREEQSGISEDLKSLREYIDQKLAGDDAAGRMEDALDLRLKDTEEVVHRENVKVYRNVQAVVQEELAKQSGDIKSTVYESTGKIRVGKGLLPVGIITLLAALGSLAMTLLQYFHII